MFFDAEVKSQVKSRSVLQELHKATTAKPTSAYPSGKDYKRDLIHYMGFYAAEGKSQKNRQLPI